MKKQNFLKVFILSAAMVAGLLLPTSMSAQKSDGFFRGGETEIYENREEFIIDGNTSGGLQNDAIGDNLPIGNGLIILSIAGAGYLLSKRKRSFKANATLLVTFAMLLGLTQCKKKIEQVQPDNSPKISITLDVSGGSKVGVDPYNNEVNAPVTYEEGDRVWVGYGGELVGKLTYDGSVFKGDITATPDGEDSPLHFYFFGGGGIDGWDDELGEKYIINISDQTDHYPVISYAHSIQPYTGSGTYTAELKNKCSIVKFNVANSGVLSNLESIKLCGVNNIVYVDFGDPYGTNNGFSFCSSNGVVWDGAYFYADGQGYITMNHKTGAEHPGEYWAIMLPQNAMSAGVVGSVFTSDNYMGSHGEIPEILQDKYMSDGINISISAAVPTNAFSISPIKKVFFSPSNLQYQANSTNAEEPPYTPAWRFSENQWEVIGENNENRSESYNGWIDLFCWGTSGYNHGAILYRPWEKCENTGSARTEYLNYYAYGDYTKNLDDENGTADWGYNTIYNAKTGNNENGWYTMSSWRWSYLTNDDAHYSAPEREDKMGLATITYEPGKSVVGRVIVPDLWTTPSGLSFNTDLLFYSDNEYDLTQWNLMENAGAVFLPAAGKFGALNGGWTHVYDDDGDYGWYWCSDSRGEITCSSFWFDEDRFGCGGYERQNGYSVRLVRDITSSDK